MLQLQNIKYIYFLGIGGIGMSALARYFKAAGKVVCGYDKTATELTNELINEGIPVHFDDALNSLPDFLSGMGVNPEAIIVFTPAIPKTNVEFIHLNECGYRLWKRSEVLGLITDEARTIAVAGTHGKTTTSTMVAHILRQNGVECTAFLGGISKNYDTNLLLCEHPADDEVMVVEADEFDRSFLTLHPDIAVITSMDADHLDIYGDHNSLISSYKEFASQVKPDGTLIYKAGLPLQNQPTNFITYGTSDSATFSIKNVRIIDGNYVFDVQQGGALEKDFRMQWPGRHNVENACGALAACRTFGISYNGIRKALDSFQGVKRRFDYQIRTKQVVFIDDYAHHPEELRATIESVKELYSGKKILGIFQPHLFTRTRDFADGFGTSLSLLDELILLDIYPARELPLPGITSQMIADKVTINNKKVVAKDQLVKEVLESDANVILTLGAGDIDQLIQPLKNALEQKYRKQPA